MTAMASIPLAKRNCMNYGTMVYWLKKVLQMDFSDAKVWIKYRSSKIRWAHKVLIYKVDPKGVTRTQTTWQMVLSMLA